MKVTDVEAVLLRQPGELDTTIADGSQDALIVRVHTDEGITGVGEIDSLPYVAKAVIEAPASHAIASGLGALLVGEDPLDIDAAWQRLYSGSIYYGRRGVAVHAISGIEIALWDIAGQAAGKPIHELLGGAKRDRVKAYASTLMPETPEEAAKVVEEQLGCGLRRDQARLGAVRARRRPRRRPWSQAARTAGGDDFDLMLDIGLGWTDADEAIDRVAADGGVPAVLDRGAVRTRRVRDVRPARRGGRDPDRRRRGGGDADRLRAADRRRRRHRRCSRT